ncbi:Similar to slc29a4: Equilibrative nucleoside transporter 4 (Danio rerio) [Cotesia congregata]|uniref:Similar to slc29a4: Equilibrative nucleoside transporter 4 (Danio rerio) n=2 Tax=Cotesia congregata TaxID=51543 RepID=A0A8J2MMP5_COTCN|nr:Similar to slc29a4: Equilibrative nucleoside transporter 4 (Danio rerio) [Cotesia congregata]CAG5096499.1 Similar to slc29a4: Equilibrative nucleoside transporter 4 (Danio rerio) [Cotesia congregata]
MDENLSRGYVQLGKARGVNEFKFVNGLDHLTPPVDRYNFVYLALVLAGAGFLLPYNSFVIPVDYFQARYPGTTVIFDMSVVYITMAFFAVCANNILVETISLNTRIAFGYIVSFVTLNFVVISEIWWELFGVATSYTINLIAVAVVSIGCTVQQSSFYGYTSMLPSRYTQAVMAGESLAGFWVSINRLVTKLLINDERGNTSIFFILSITTILLCTFLYRLVRKTEFVQFYIHLCQERNKITLEPTEDIGLMDPLEQVDSSKGQYGILKLQTSPLAVDSGADSNGAQYSAFSFSNPVYEPNGPSGNSLSGTGPKYKVEDVVVMRGFSRNQSSKPWSGIKRGLLARLEVAKLIFPYMASIGVAYFVTLCLYPGIVSEIISCKFESWMPVILMAAFNGADLLGKILASISYEWTRTQLVYFSIARILLIPLFLLCAIPRHAPILSSEIYPLLFSWLLGLTNGIVGSVPMIQAPSKVPEEHRELAGNIMTLSYTTGLTLGSLLAYILDAFLGHPVTTKEICVNLLTATVPTTFISNNITTDILASSIKLTTLPTIKNISKISNMLMTTTATKMATQLTTSLMTNKTAILLGNALNTTSTTTVPIIFTNVTSTISNAIIQH